LQDQHTDLDKWEPEEPDTISKDVTEDNERLAIDERDTARDAVLEGQAMAVYLDYTLKPGQESADLARRDANSQRRPGCSGDSSPVMAGRLFCCSNHCFFPIATGWDSSKGC
jgi:hypothetical protein